MLRRLTILVIVLAILGGAGWFWLRARITTPYRGFSEPEIFVELPSGTSVAGIADKLAEAGVVPDALTFRLAARFNHYDRHLQAGEYRFADPATPGDVAARLARGDVYKHPVTFPEGLTIHEMAAIFDRSGLGTAADFEAAAANTTLVAEIDPDAASLEGYLFPDTYTLPRHTDAAGVVKAMVSGFLKAFDTPLRNDAVAQNMSAHDVVTLASIIEKETAGPEERPIVSAVYRNRLKLGMALQCDPTVIYGLMLAGRWDGNIRKNDLDMDSPYNTYRHAGLPPGPIASPGRASLQAALHPAPVDYLYFVSRNDGTHVFASTLAEHNKNVSKYQGRGRH